VSYMENDAERRGTGLEYGRNVKYDKYNMY
jgi:hypothetical protein